MKNLFILSVFVFISFQLTAQTYSRVEIYVQPNEYQRLASLGLPLDDAYFSKNFITAELNQTEINKIEQAGFEVQILIPDMEKYYQKRLAQPKNIKTLPNTPQHFHLGSFGGNLNYEEVLAELDTMHNLYPNLITVKAVIDSEIPTHNDSLLYWVKISDNPNVDEDEPEVLYTGLHHAREPVSMMHLIYYMWYLLENYGTDDYATYLVDNFEQYFVPVVNVDGYKYNQQTDPNGGGMWRKNRRDNGDGTYGVDPNRNYPYMWGYDDSGSSPDSGDETYRGPSAGSEPCVQNIMEFVNNHNFLIANNHHTYSDLMLYPFGYDENSVNPDLDLFVAYAQIMTRENHYTCGRAWELLYPVNGEADDWFYGEKGVYAFTAETGSSSDGFWPSQDRIIPLCEQNLYMNEMMCSLAGAYAEAKDVNTLQIRRCGYFKYDIQFLGLDTTATFKVYLSGNSVLYSDTATYAPGYSLLETITDSLHYFISPDITCGTDFDFDIVVDNGKYAFKTPVAKSILKTEVIFSDNLTTSTNWIGSWQLTTESYTSSPSSMTDSPNSNYQDDVNTSIESLDFDLSQYNNVSVYFNAKWNIENNWDCAQFQIYANNNWQNLATNGTNPGSGQGVQPDGDPIFDGNSDWALQSLNLDSSYLQNNVKFRFTLASDGSVEGDGFYFDDFSICAGRDDSIPVIVSQNTVTAANGSPFTLTPDMLNVADSDDVYPNGFCLLVLSGEHYSVLSPNTIKIDNGYTGTINAPVRVCDGYKLSDTFNLVINAVEALQNEKNNISIYPNPVQSILKIKGYENYDKITIYNNLGQKISEFRSESMIDVSFLNTGVYIIELKNDTSTIVSKFLKL